jgi:hypothetical protein
MFGLQAVYANLSVLCVCVVCLCCVVGVSGCLLSRVNAFVVVASGLWLAGLG